MAFNRKFRTDPEYKPMQICIVDKMPSIVLQLAKKFGLPIIQPEANNNVVLDKPLTYTIYILVEFENHKMFNLIQQTSNTWILGPTAVKEMADNPSLEMRSKPTYCTFMYGLKFFINCPENYTLMNRMVQLLQWMGGLFTADANLHTTHMITTSTRAKGYIYCETFKVPILTPKWVEHCWERRHIPNYNVIAAMEHFKVSAFADLYIALKGFDTEKLSYYKRAAEQNGAVVVQYDDLRCTHLVFSNDLAAHVNINDVPTHILYVVKEDWLVQSVDHQERAYEGSHSCFSPREIRSSMLAIMDAEEISEKQNKKITAFRASLTKEDQVLLDIAKLESQDIKRKYVFEELYLTEKSYLRCLKQLMNMKRLATAFQPSGSILTPSEAKIIFGNVEEIVEIHQNLTVQFEKILTDWENDAITGQVIVDVKDDLFKQYEIYVTNYKESKRVLEECEKENKRLRKFIDDTMKNLNTDHPKDLMIRPIQRLCSVCLLLRELNKNTREDNPDKQTISKAIELINEVLNKMNKDKDNVEKLKLLFDIHRLIEGCPPDLITSHREFIVQFSAQEIQNKQNCLGIQVMFFLFNDTMEITKVRSKSQAILKNCNTNRSSKDKPYKHIATLSLSMILNVIQFEGKGEDDENMFGFNIKDVKKERTACIHCFQYSEDNKYQLSEVLLLIAKQLCQRDSSKSPKDYILDSVPTRRLSIEPIYFNSQQRMVSSALDKVSNIFKRTPKQTLAPERPILRKSLSCNDILEASNAL